MSHGYHEGERGYSAAQVLHDGCDECKQRSVDPSDAIARFDGHNFVTAWQRAAAWNRTGLADIADVERPVLSVLWSVQLQLERLGVPIGTVPTGGLL